MLKVNCYETATVDELHDVLKHVCENTYTALFEHVHTYPISFASSLPSVLTRYVSVAMVSVEHRTKNMLDFWTVACDDRCWIQVAWPLLKPPEVDGTWMALRFLLRLCVAFTYAYAYCYLVRTIFFCSLSSVFWDEFLATAKVKLSWRCIAGVCVWNWRSEFQPVFDSASKLPSSGLHGTS